MRLSPAALCLVLLAALLPVAVTSREAPAQEAVPAPVALSPDDLADIERVEDYLNGIDSMQARFVQMSSTGEVSEGGFKLRKPGKMRIDYDPPTPIRITANGLFLVYEDTELEQQTHILVSSTPVGFLLSNDIDLNGEDISVVGIERGEATLTVRLVQRDNPDNGDVSLVFSDRPLMLRRWVITDPQGVRTNFALSGAEVGVGFDDRDFIVEQYGLRSRDRN